MFNNSMCSSTNKSSTKMRTKPPNPNPAQPTPATCHNAHHQSYHTKEAPPNPSAINDISNNNKHQATPCQEPPCHPNQLQTQMRSQMIFLKRTPTTNSMKLSQPNSQMLKASDVRNIFVASCALVVEPNCTPCLICCKAMLLADAQPNVENRGQRR